MMHSKWFGRSVIAAILLLGLFPFVHKGTGGTSEFPVYTLAGERMLAGEEIYRTDEVKPFTYPPFFALPFTLGPELPLLPPRPREPIVGWYLVNAVALTVIFLLVHQLVAQLTPSPSRLWVFYLVTLLLAGRYVGSVFGNQSHDLLVFLPIVLGLHALTREKEVSAALWLAVAASFKATPLLFLAVFFLQRRWRGFGVMLAATVGLSLLPDLIFPREEGGLWVWAWLSTFVLKLAPGGPADIGPWHASSILNQSLGGTLARILPEFWPKAVIMPFAQLSVLVMVCFAVFKRQSGTGYLVAQFAAVVCGMVLLSPMSSKAHFCVLLLPVAVLVRDILVNRTWISGCLLGIVFVLGTLTSKDLVGRELGNQILHYGTVTWASFALLVGVIRLTCKPEIEVQKMA